MDIIERIPALRKKAGVFKQTHQVGLVNLLQSPMNISVSTGQAANIGQLSGSALERALEDQKILGFPVPPDFTESNSPRQITMRYLWLLEILEA